MNVSAEFLHGKPQSETNISLGVQNAALPNRVDRIHLESAYGLYENQPWL